MNKFEHVHQKIGEEVRSIAGYYTVLEEDVLEYNGRRVLYEVKMAVVETSCCGSGGLGFIFVPGYILSLKDRQTPNGLWVSEVERIVEESEKKDIEKELRRIYPHFYEVSFA